MTALTTPKNAVFSSLRQFFDEIDGEKQAAAPLSEPGSIGGETTHPSKSVDDHLIKLQEGARFKENTSDVKEQEGAASVENAGDPKGQMQYETQIGVKHAPTGEDPAVEDDFKGTKEDPGTTSVMKADDGEKYGEWDFKKLAAAIGSLGNEIMADLGAGKVVEKRAAPAAPKSPTQKAAAALVAPAKADEKTQDPEADEETKAAAAAGYKLAAVLGLDEGGADAQVQAMVETVIKEAQAQAVGVAQFIDAYYKTVKQAGDPAATEGEGPGAGAMPPGGDPAAGGDPMAGGDPAAGGPGGPGGGQDPMEILAQLPPEVLQQLVAAIQQGGLGGGGGDPAMGGAGGPPGMAGPGGGGGPPPGAGDPTENLSGAMHEMGVSPDEVSAAAPKVAADQRETLLKIAAAVKDRRRSGRLGYKMASTPYDEAVRAEMRQYLAEVIGN
jgi:hypothetical protein